MSIDTILKIGGALLGFAGTTVEAVQHHKRANQKIDESVQKKVDKYFDDLEQIEKEAKEKKEES